MTWGRALKQAPKCKKVSGIIQGFSFHAIQEARLEWRSRAYSKQHPERENPIRRIYMGNPELSFLSGHSSARSILPELKSSSKCFSATLLTVTAGKNRV